MEPLAVLGTAYSSYYLAEVFHWSGIISLIGCGITQVKLRSSIGLVSGLIGCGITQVKLRSSIGLVSGLIGCGITQVKQRSSIGPASSVSLAVASHRLS